MSSKLDQLIKLHQQTQAAKEASEKQAHDELVVRLKQEAESMLGDYWAEFAPYLSEWEELTGNRYGLKNTIALPQSNPMSLIVKLCYQKDYEIQLNGYQIAYNANLFEEKLAEVIFNNHRSYLIERFNELKAILDRPRVDRPLELSEFQTKLQPFAESDVRFFNEQYQLYLAKLTAMQVEAQQRELKQSADKAEAAAKKAAYAAEVEAYRVAWAAYQAECDQITAHNKAVALDIQAKYDMPFWVYELVENIAIKDGEDEDWVIDTNKYSCYGPSNEGPYHEVINYTCASTTPTKFMNIGQVTQPKQVRPSSHAKYCYEWTVSNQNDHWIATIYFDPTVYYKQHEQIKADIHSQMLDYPDRPQTEINSYDRGEIEGWPIE